MRDGQSGRAVFLLMVDLQKAFEVYQQRGWTTMPLENDPQGFPKKPFLHGWQHFDQATEVGGWEKATGIGVILGQASNGLCVIDIDDVEMAEEAFKISGWTRQVQTIRKRGHLYFEEEDPSPSSAITINWQGRDVKVELKSNGTQVAAPPTPGYKLRTPPVVVPFRVPNIAWAWAKICIQLQVVESHVERTSTKPWSPYVHKDNRNNTLYIEAHKLREAGMSLELALDHLKTRWEAKYEPGDMDWSSVEATIRSAYKKPVPEAISGRDSYQLWAGPRNEDRTGPSDSS